MVGRERGLMALTRSYILFEPCDGFVSTSWEIFLVDVPVIVLSLALPTPRKSLMFSFLQLL